MISLRTALDSSREELRRLKEAPPDFSSDNYDEAVERLALENHVLRRRLLLGKRAAELDSDAGPQPIIITRSAKSVSFDQTLADGRV